MKCPYCGEDNDKVVDSRSMNEGQSIRRRRECLACAKRFTTYEHVDSIAVMVIKRDRRREPYSREKLVEGVRLSCRKRPVSEDQIEEVASQVEMKINSRFEKEIESAALGDLGVFEELRPAAPRLARETLPIIGTVRGDISASESIEIHAPARVYGNLSSPALEIQRGSVFEGNCQMDGSGQHATTGNGQRKRDKAPTPTDTAVVG